MNQWKTEYLVMPPEDIYIYWGELYVYWLDTYTELFLFSSQSWWETHAEVGID